MPREIEPALAALTTNLKWHIAHLEPFRSRFEACATLKAAIERMWDIVRFDVDTFLDESDKEPGCCNCVVADFAKEIAAIACRMLIELDLSEPAVRHEPQAAPSAAASPVAPSTALKV